MIELSSTDQQLLPSLTIEFFMAKINLAQQLATTLEQAGIKRIWGLTGDSLNGLTGCVAHHGQHRVDARSPRGSRRIRRRCRSGGHR